MPSKYTLKSPLAETFYHVFNRGVDRQLIFRETSDYTTFLGLLKRHLSNEPACDRFGRQATHLKDQIEINAFCLMPNHFHLLVYNKTEAGLANLMRSVMTAYSMYFNRKYKRTGTLFQGTYKASPIYEESYFLHISRYIHLNPQDIGQKFEEYPYSSYPYYIGKKHAEWLNSDRIMELYENDIPEYKAFVKDYESARAELKEIQHTLADH